MARLMDDFAYWLITIIICRRLVSGTQIGRHKSNYRDMVISDISLEQRETILNLYKSGIWRGVIALQMDLNREHVLVIINETNI